MLLDGLNGSGSTLCFSDHADQPCLLQHHLGKTIHPGGGGGAGWANSLVTDWIDRTHVVDHSIGEVDAVRQSFTGSEEVGNFFVGGISTGEQFPAQE